MGLRGLSFGPKRSDYGSERADFGSERGLGGTDRQTDVRKFTPVSYRTSALWGRCPKRVKDGQMSIKRFKDGQGRTLSLKEGPGTTKKL